MSIKEMMDRYELSPEECYDIPEPATCPECENDSLFPSGSENYGTDRDGNRGVKLYYSLCSECGYEGESF